MTGGGYIYPAGTQYNFFWDFLQTQKVNAAVVILSFSLAPGGQYPLQIRQAVGLIDWLLSHGKKPGDVMSNVFSKSSLECALRQ